MRKRAIVPWIVATVCTLGFTGLSSAAEWQQIGNLDHHSASGISAVPGNGVYLVVHDGKHRKEPRIGLLTSRPGKAQRYVELQWPAKKIPRDLEAICRLPGNPWVFVTVTSGGDAFVLRFDREGNRLTLLRHFEIPNDDEVEGLDIFRVGKAAYIVWGERGSDRRAGRITWARIDLDNFRLGRPQHADFHVPWPPEAVRHIADLKVAPDLSMYSLSAMDQGDQGPFAGALWRAGRFVEDRGRVRFVVYGQRNPLVRIADRKPEALELLGTGGPQRFAIATDDEDFGGRFAIFNAPSPKSVHTARD